MPIRRHPRSIIVQKARNEIGLMLIELEQKHNLTSAEVISILAGEIQSHTKYMIREDRHGDADKPGDLE